METKVFELRDSLTFIPVIAIQVSRDDHRLFWRAGYGHTPSVLLMRAEGKGKVTCDPYDWGDRTMTTAHLHIESNWDSLFNGEVVDVEYILGETDEPKFSEI